MNKKIFLAALLCTSIGIAGYLYTIEQPNIEHTQKENYAQDKNHTLPELSNIKNNSFDIQNSSANLTQKPFQKQNLSVDNISKNEPSERVYKYIFKNNYKGKTREANITIYVKEEVINGTHDIVAKSKWDNVPYGFLSPYESIEYVNTQTGDIKLIKIPCKVIKDGKIKCIPEDKKEYEFPSDIIYSNKIPNKEEEDLYSSIMGEIYVLHPLYLIGFVKFKPENLTITKKTTTINITPLEFLDAQSCLEFLKEQNYPFELYDDKEHYCYFGMSIFNISYTKNSTKGIIIQKNYIDKSPISIRIDHKLTPEELEEEDAKIRKSSYYSLEDTTNIIFLGTEIFRGREAYKIKAKSEEKMLDGLGKVDELIWIDKKDKIILFANASTELIGFYKESTIYELKNVSIVKNEG